VDRAFSRFDLAEAAGYRRFLSAMASAYLAVEAAVDAAGGERILEDWGSRRRSDLLRSDLADLHLAPQISPGPRLLQSSEVLGAIYVLEGSRLGGRVLSSKVGAGLPVRFLATPSLPGAWPDFLSILRQRLASEGELRSAGAAASSCFRFFETAAFKELEPIRA
jgi:heme oxygenase